MSEQAVPEHGTPSDALLPTGTVLVSAPTVPRQPHPWHYALSPSLWMVTDEHGLGLVVRLRVRGHAGGRDAKLATTQGFGEEGVEGSGGVLSTTPRQAECGGEQVSNPSD